MDPIHIPNYPATYLSIYCLSTYLPSTLSSSIFHLSTYLVIFTHSSTNPSFFLSVHVSTYHPCMHPSNHPCMHSSSVHPCIHPIIHHPSIHGSIHHPAIYTEHFFALDSVLEAGDTLEKQLDTIPAFAVCQPSGWPEKQQTRDQCARSARESPVLWAPHIHQGADLGGQPGWCPH